MFMKASKPVQWKKKFLECKTIKHKEKIIPLNEMLGKKDGKKDTK